MNILLLATLLTAHSPARAEEPNAGSPVPTRSAVASAPQDMTADAPAASSDPTPIVGPPAGPPLSGKALEDATRTIASQLRCPVCQGLSVADSPSESAVAIKREVERLAAQGYTEAQCLLYFEASYGEFIRLEPKAEGLNLLVWAGPGALLVFGLGVIAWMRLGNRKPPAPRTLPPVDPALEPFVRQVYAVVGEGQS